MTEFWWGALALLALAALFLCLPGWFLRARYVNDRTESNRDWFARRQTELKPGAGDSGVDATLSDDLLHDAKLRMLDEAATEPVKAQTSVSSRRRMIAPLLVATLALLSSTMYWRLGAVPDVQLKQALDTVTVEGDEADYRRLMLQIEDRAGERPENLYYQAMLGRFYMGEGDYKRALATYRGLVAQAPNDAGAAALAAQAGFMAGGRVLSEQDRLMAEQALAIDPHQRTALGLLGVASYEQQEYQAAIAYWQRLLVMEAPGSPAAEMIAGVIERARSALQGDAPALAGHSAGAAPGRPAQPASSVGQPAAAQGVGITVRIALADGAQPAASDTVFVFARNPAVESRMPIAVQRLNAGSLPTTVRLDDASSMAGQKISVLSAVDVVARVSPGGQPGEQHASYQAKLSGLAPTGGEQVHTLVLTPVGES